MASEGNMCVFRSSPQENTHKNSTKTVGDRLMVTFWTSLDPNIINYIYTYIYIYIYIIHARCVETNVIASKKNSTILGLQTSVHIQVEHIHIMDQTTGGFVLVV